MSRNLQNAVCRVALALALLLCAAPAYAGFHFRLPSSRRASQLDKHGPSAHTSILGDASSFRLEAAYRDAATGTLFARHSCGLPPPIALEAASRALAEAGWRLAFASASVALFENAAGKCAAVAAMTAPDGATSVAVLVQE